MTAPVGEVPPFLRRRLRPFVTRQVCYDDVIAARPFGKSFLLTDPADVKHVLVTNADNYLKTPRLSGGSAGRRDGSGLLTSSGQRHRRQRSALAPGFRRASMEALADIVADRIEQRVRLWRSGATIDLSAEMTALAQTIMVGLLFGRSAAGIDEAALCGAIDERRRYTEYVYYSRIPWRESLPTPQVRRYRRAIGVLDEILYGAIAAERQSPEATDGLLAFLAGARYEDGSRMTDQLVRDEALTLTSTGYETIGDGLTWTWHLLMRHPEVGLRLAAEVDSVLGGSPPRPEDLDHLVHAQNVLAESLRLYPPTWIYARVPRQPDVLPGGRAIAAGSIVYVCQYLLHRHPRYFDDPEAFRPDRFQSQTRRAAPSSVYLPFGHGPHRCIGEHLARLEGLMVLASVAQRFRFEPEPRQEVTPFAGITLRPKDGLRVSVYPRTS